MLLLIQSYPGGNETLKRNWPFFLRAGATETWIIGTEAGECWAPEGIPLKRVGKDCYIDGPHLPSRLLDTLIEGLKTDHDYIMVCEYDVLFFFPIRFYAVEGIAAHRAGSTTWGSLSNSYYHNPWLFRREEARKFVELGKASLGVCTRSRGEPSTAESSPDVFFGYVTEKMHVPVQTDLWTEYSRNGYDIPGHLEQAREARLNGVQVIHGIKTQAEFDFLMS